MRVRMKVEMSGTRAGRSWPPRGGVIDLPDGEAAHLCEVGIAEPVAEPPPAETATAPPAEVAQPPEVETPVEPEPEKRGRGRPRKPRDAEGNIVRE